jgi:single-stranded-DNA-specific exonuclease
MKWIVAPAPDKKLAAQLAAEFCLPPALAGLLCRRGIRTADAAGEFLNPRLSTLSDPFLLPNMTAATERILAAVDRGEKIVLYGDYDVDGVTSLAIFKRVLDALGAKPECFLPLRMDEGYGLTPDGVERCLAEHSPRLLLALDCGTSSANEIAGLQKSCVDVVVFDHHEIKTAKPDCILVNPKLGHDFHYLCSAGVVFKACHALLKTRATPSIDLRDYLDLVALGTVADVVPLVDENRILVRKGLEQLERTNWVGLRVLMELAGVRAPARPADVGFRIGPRLNAAGRLGTAQDALELLLTTDPSRARTIAVALDTQNRDRQLVEQRILRDAEQTLSECFNPRRDAAIVIGGENWHPGVLGIVASRLSKTHHRPTFVIGFDDEGGGRGSGRSIDGFSLVRALTHCRGHLERFGGHEMAAGLTLKRDHFDGFQKAFLACAHDWLTEEDLVPRVHVDAELDLGDLNFDFLESLDMLQPFGTGNPQPVFHTNGVTLTSEPRLLKEKHYLFSLRQGDVRYPAIFFNGAVGELPRLPWDVAFQVERNEYEGRVSVQMQVHSIRASRLR